MQPRLSIVIPSHNRADLLGACLRSITAKAPVGTEILVIDDGSVEATVSAVAEAFAGVRVLRNEKAQGFCVAANQGIRAAQSDIVQLLNDDTEVAAGWAEPALAHFRKEDVVAVSPLVLLPDGKRIDSAGDGYRLGGWAYKRFHGRAVADVELQAGEVFGANGTASFFRKAVYLQVGGMPEEFGAYFDDVDLSFRLRQAGYRIWHEPASQVIHHVSSSYGRPRGQLLQRQSRNEELVFWRNLSAWRLVLVMPLHGVVLLAKSIRRLREGTFRPFLSGRLAAWRQLPEVFRQREKRLVGWSAGG